MAEQPKKRTFRTYAYRGVDLADLLEMPAGEVLEMFTARHKRKAARQTKEEKAAIDKLVAKCIESRKGVEPGARPPTVKTHLRSLTITPDMIGSVIGCYTGRVFVAVEIKPEMIGHYLGEFAFTYKPCFHSKAGSKAALARFLPQ